MFADAARAASLGYAGRIEARAAFENAKSHQQPRWDVFDDASGGQLPCDGGGRPTVLTLPEPAGHTPAP